MNTLRLKSIRVGKGLGTSDMANILNLNQRNYYNREIGRINFSDEEKVAVSKSLDFSFADFNDIFFDGKLPF